MSQPCAIVTCKRVSRALCHCCQQDVCIAHLNEHNDLLNSQLNPFVDEINALGDRLKKLNTQAIVGDCHQKLEQWREDCHKKIDNFFQRKCQELDGLITVKVDQQWKQILQIRSKVAELIREQEATREVIDTLTFTIRQLEKEMNKIEQTSFRINIPSLVIDDNLMKVHEINKRDLDLTPFSSVYRTIKYSPKSFRSLASNNRLLLIHQIPNLHLVDTEIAIVKQVPWAHEGIHDMCWSSTLDRFIVVEENNIFLVDERTMSIENVKTTENRKWLSCAHSDTSLFLTTREWGSSIVVLSLLPSIAVVKEWKSPITCAKDEYINGIVYNKKTLALVIKNKIEKSLRLELRSCKRLDHIWSLSLNIMCNQNIAFRCCSLDSDEWLVPDYENGLLLQITKDGKLKTTIPYNSIPYRVNLFGSNMLAVAAEKGINFHKILHED